MLNFKVKTSAKGKSNYRSMQCTYNVTPRHVRGNIVAVCLLPYPVYTAHAPYFIVICGLSVCTMFFTLSHKRHDFRKIVFEQKMCLEFLCSVCLKDFLLYEKFDKILSLNLHMPLCEVTTACVKF
jgi:hypothetical protein